EDRRAFASVGASAAKPRRSSNRHLRQAAAVLRGESGANRRPGEVSDPRAWLHDVLHGERGGPDSRSIGLARSAGAACFAEEAKRRNADPVVLRTTFIGANRQPRVVGRDELPGKAHYFIGNDPAKWRTNVPMYARVHYQEIYPGIDLVYYGTQRQLEYDFVVSPGADPKAITLAFEGVDGVAIDAMGDLVLRADGSEVRLRKPVVYQEQ